MKPDFQKEARALLKKVVANSYVGAQADIAAALDSAYQAGRESESDQIADHFDALSTDMMEEATKEEVAGESMAAACLSLVAHDYSAAAAIVRSLKTDGKETGDE